MAALAMGGKTVEVFASTRDGRPVVYLNTFEGEGGRVFERLRACGCPDFNLVAVSGLTWEQDMVPWDAPASAGKGRSYTGGADAYLDLLVSSIVPQAEERLAGTPAWRGIAGYSLAGLFAVYAPYQTSAFSRVASMSGSLWFPGLMEYLHAHEMRRVPDFVYLSVGDKESKTRSPLMRCVRRNTEQAADYYRAQGIPVAFELNPGNHFTDVIERTAAGIRRMLEAGE